MELNPAQQEVVSLLGKGGERVPIREDLPAELMETLVDELTPARNLLPEGTQVWVGKRTLTALLACEAQAMAERKQPFNWTTAMATGQVAHKAIELMVHWQGEAIPALVVDEALARLVDGDKSISQFVGSLSAADRAELRAYAVAKVTTFSDCFPPLSPKWRPVTESGVKVELFDAAIVLSGKTDLTLGVPGDRVIIDLKSGRSYQSHWDDLRFYALLETLKLGLAPRKVASYYLETARPHVEDVTEGILWASVARTVEGVARLIELEQEVRPPDVRPGPQCRWCPLCETCKEGAAFLARLDDPDVVDPW